MHISSLSCCLSSLSRSLDWTDCVAWGVQRGLAETSTFFAAGLVQRDSACLSLPAVYGLFTYGLLDGGLGVAPSRVGAELLRVAPGTFYDSSRRSQIKRPTTDNNDPMLLAMKGYVNTP